LFNNGHRLAECFHDGYVKLALKVASCGVDRETDTKNIGAFSTKSCWNAVTGFTVALSLCQHVSMSEIEI